MILPTAQSKNAQSIPDRHTADPSTVSVSIFSVLTSDIRPYSPRDPDTMETELRALIASVTDEHIPQLLDALLGPTSKTWALYRVAPAAKRNHHAYVHGLLEHSLSVAQAVVAVAAIFPDIDRDIALCGALLHDIGKLDAYSCDDPIEMTDDGRLFGEIPLGYYRVRREIEQIPKFPQATARALLHIILAHHGQLAYGSPVVPATREATVVHMIDNLGSKLGSFDRLQKDLSPGAIWSKFDSTLDARAYFGPPTATEFRIADRRDDRPHTEN